MHWSLLKDTTDWLLVMSNGAIYILEDAIKSILLYAFCLYYHDTYE